MSQKLLRSLRCALLATLSAPFTLNQRHWLQILSGIIAAVAYSVRLKGTANPCHWSGFAYRDDEQPESHWQLCLAFLLSCPALHW